MFKPAPPPPPPKKKKNQNFCQIHLLVIVLLTYKWHLSLKKNGKKLMIYLHMKTNSSVFWFNIVFAIIHFVFYSLSFLYLSLHQCIIPLSVKMCLFFYIVCLFHQYHYKFHTDYILQWYVHTFRVILLASGFC